MNPQRILVADDHPAFVRIISFNLGKAGYEVATAYDGQQARRLLETQSFDLMVTDEQMPYFSGRELCCLVRQLPHLQHIPLILLTAKGFEIDFTSARKEFGISLLMSKPFSPRELVRNVKRLLPLDASSFNAQPQAPASCDWQSAGNK